MTIGHAALISRLHDRGPVPDRHGRDPAERRARRHRLDRRGRHAASSKDMKVPPRSLVMGSPGQGEAAADATPKSPSIQAYADRYVGYRLDYMNTRLRRRRVTE